MKVGRSKLVFLVLILLVITFSNAQSVEINGKVIIEDDDIEGIHVINKTANRFTITNENGSFIIPATLNDTIIFSAIKYKPKEVVITREIIKSKILNVYLTELVNVLNEVVVGKILTGNLLSDIQNKDVKRDINFYDLGIPGYTGKPLTLAENRYNEATTGGGFIPLNPILNYFSGRTKMLKNHLKLERLSDCLDRIKSDLAKTFFYNNELSDDLKAEFFFYCLEDEEFSSICQIKNDLATLEFLTSRLDSYKANRQVEKD